VGALESGLGKKEKGRVSARVMGRKLVGWLKGSTWLGLVLVDQLKASARRLARLSRLGFIGLVGWLTSPSCSFPPPPPPPPPSTDRADPCVSLSLSFKLWQNQSTELFWLKYASYHYASDINSTHFKQNNPWVCRVTARFNHGSTRSK
jgi:hypothetical protein